MTNSKNCSAKTKPVTTTPAGSGKTTRTTVQPESVAQYNQLWATVLQLLLILTLAARFWQLSKHPVE